MIYFQGRNNLFHIYIGPKAWQSDGALDTESKEDNLVMRQLSTIDHPGRQ